MTTPTKQLSDAGVSIWLDDLSRSRLETGTLQKLIEEKNVVGVTTNPSIFHAAITAGTDYDATIAAQAAAGASVEDTIFEITTTDVADACDLFAPVAAATKGVDGRVSIEVDPRLAWDTAGTIAEAKHLYKKVNKDNVHIKIPATLEGLEAITATLAEGIAARVVSMPCVEWFNKQDAAYRESVLPPAVKARVSVEAGLALGWREFVGDAGRSISLEHYGASADYKRLFKEFGITAEAVAAAAKDSLAGLQA